MSRFVWETAELFTRPDCDDEEEEEEEEEEGPTKEELVKNDVALVKDIFSYIDQTNKRLAAKFTLERELDAKNAAQQRKDQLERQDNPDLSWAQYENLDEAQRADLLEKAIMVLAQDWICGKIWLKIIPSSMWISLHFHGLPLR